jgi:tRNA(fMet)-specific endonuclease VapC
LKANGNIAVDSNAVIAYRAGNARACAAINGSAELFMPTMVLGELMYGALNSARPTENEKAVRAFADQCVIMGVDQAVAERYAVIRMALKRKGKPMPENDVWIAALCMEYDVTLVTHDAHFNHVDRLRVFNWESE